MSLLGDQGLCHATGAAVRRAVCGLTLAVATLAAVDPLPPASAAQCAGDCNNDGVVTVSELVEGVSIALGRIGISECDSIDVDGNGQATIDELLGAVDALVHLCGPDPNPSSTPSFATPTPTPPPRTGHVVGSCRRPGSAGLEPCSPGTTVSAAVCSERSTCLDGPMPTPILGSAEVDAAGRFSIPVTEPFPDPDVIRFQANVAGSQIYRVAVLFDIGLVSNRARGVEPEPSIEIDPRSEAATRLIAETGLEQYIDSGIAEINGRVRSANPEETFAGLEVGAAADQATDAARSNEAVRDAVQANRVLQPDSPVTTDIVPAGDLDLYEFELLEDGPVVLQATIAPFIQGQSVCLELREFGTLETVPGGARCNNPPFGGPTAGVSLSLPRGRYSVVVSGSTDIIYNLLYLPLRSEAPRLQHDIPVAGQIAPAGDLDPYEIDIAVDSIVTVQATIAPFTQGQSICLGLRAFGAIDTLPDGSACNNPPFGGSVARINLFLPGGRYRVVISGSNGISYNLIALFIDAEPTRTPTITPTSTPTRARPPGSGTYLEEDFENGLDRWRVSESDWALVDDDFVSPGHSVTDSPNESYPPNSNATLELRNALDLSRAAFPVLTFWEKYDIAGSYCGNDVAVVEVSDDGGFTWDTTLSSRTCSTVSTWTHNQIDLREHRGSAVKVRFRLRSNADESVGDGWSIDDVAITEVDDQRTAIPFLDDFEGSLGAWIVSGSDWAIVEDDSVSPSHSVTDSPQGDYPPNTNATLELRYPIDLSATTSPVLTFWHKYTIGGSYCGNDRAVVEASVDGGFTWDNTLFTSTCDPVSTWTYVQIDLRNVIGPTVKIRFRLFANYDTSVGSGWSIDDVEIYDLVK